MKTSPGSGSQLPPESLENRVCQFMRLHGLVAPGQKVLVGISGGPDSLCLTYVLLQLRASLGLVVYLAHLDHGLRGQESEADAEYVSELAASLGVPCTIEKRDVGAYARERRLSLEEAAREVRYAFLARTARSLGVDVVAVGHTQDDQVETVLLHILRGSGTSGLAGLRPLQNLEIGGQRIRLVRPLLALTHREAKEYCHQLKLSPRTDSSNRSLRMLRNRVRHRLLPALKEYNQAISTSLLRLAEIAAEDQEYLEREGAFAFNRVASRAGQAIQLDKAGFRSLPSALQRQVVRVAIGQLCGTLKDIESRHIRKVLEALDRPTGRKINLPYGLVFAIDYGCYRISRGSPQESAWPAIEGEFLVAVPGLTRCPGWTVEAAILPADAVDLKIESDPWTGFFDARSAGTDIVMRSLRRGDRFQPLGMPQFKTAAEFLLDAKVPAAARLRVPILVTPAGLIWLAGQRIDERFKVTPDSDRVLCLHLSSSAKGG